MKGNLYKMRLILTLFLFSVVGLSTSQAVRKCPIDAGIDHGTVTIYEYLGVAFFKCSLGYELKGKSLVSCKDGSISHDDSFSICKPKVCISLRTPVYGSKLCDKAPLTVGKTCLFGCRRGYSLSGFQNRTCLASGRWSGSRSTCHLGRTDPIVKATCSHPPELANGTVVGCSPLQNLRTGDFCRFKCNTGYCLLGPFRLYCNRYGKLVDDDEQETVPRCRHQSHTACKQSEQPASSTTYRAVVVQIRTSEPGKCGIANGGCDQICDTTSGNCRCRIGYRLSSDKKTCEGCPVNSYRDSRDAQCHECPRNSYTDSDVKTSIEDCRCRLGFVRIMEDNILSCLDVNECAEGNFGCSHVCVNTPGSAHCTCPRGYKIDEDGKTCIDIDECDLKNGGCEGSCVNFKGGFECSCPPGFHGLSTNSYVCEDDDECATDNGGCEQLCVNFAGGHYCSCNNGYRIDNNGRTCTRIVCRGLIRPHHSNVKCHIPDDSSDSDRQFNVVTRSTVDKNFPVNTTCKIRCNRGFKANTTSYVTCGDDGKWNGEVPVCHSLQCPALTSPVNGAVRPKKCSTGDMMVKQKCYFLCNRGYHLVGKPVFTCKNELKWSYEEIPQCIPDAVIPYISCPADMTADLPFGNASVLLAVPRPDTNMENIAVQPEWVRIEEKIAFPSGKTKVMFSVENSDTNETAMCFIDVNVLDKEPPTITRCPSSIEVLSTNGESAMVTWKEPNITDNVEVSYITKTIIPGASLNIGQHIVEYIAKDEAGNFASCSFNVNVSRKECSVPVGPMNGYANCMDLPVGKVCSPTCEEGYLRYRDDDEMFYSCDSTGIWEPSNVITDCLEYHEASSDGECPRGFEIKTLISSDENICVARLE